MVPPERAWALLREAGVADESEVEAALDRQRTSGNRLGDELIAAGAAQPIDVAQARSPAPVRLHRNKSVAPVVVDFSSKAPGPGSKSTVP